MERNNNVNVRLSDREAEQLKAMARNAGQSVSDFIRSIASGETIWGTPDPETRQAVSEALTLLRRLAAMVHELGEDGNQEEHLEGLSARVSSLVDELKEDLDAAWKNRYGRERTV